MSWRAKPSLAGLGREGLKAALASIGVPDRQLRMRVGQLWSWMYARGATSFDAMTNVSKDVRADVAGGVHPGAARDRHRAGVDRRHAQVAAAAAAARPRGRAPEIETVYIPEADRGTLCISSQIGCTLTCSFCHTGTQKLVRNLEPQEIVGQILLARDRIGDWPGAAGPGDGGLIPDAEQKDHQRRADGHGRAALQFRQCARCHGGCRRRRRARPVEAAHHASTSGVVPEIPRWGAEAGTMLAISLHAVRDELRDKLVPINRNIRSPS